MAVVGTDPVPRCSPEEWAEFRAMVSHGMLFEVIDWIEAGKPTLRPEGKTSSAFETAVLMPNLSMTQILWKRAWQEHWEAVKAIGSIGIQNGSSVVLRYLLENDCPVGHLTGSDLCETHDLDLIRLGMRRGISILEPDGWASTFIRIGSRPLIRFYLEERDRIPGLAKDAVYAMCTAIEESRLRAIALLRWAGVNPLGKAPRYEDWDEPESSWTGFPALRLSLAEKPEEILKLLKLKPNVQQWFDLLDNMACSRAEHIDATLALMNAPLDVIRSHPARSALLLTSILRSICWGWSWKPNRDERLTDFCIQLLEAGAKPIWRDADERDRFRRYFHKSGRKEQVLRILKRAAELADERAKEELICLINMPKMRVLVMQLRPEIMDLLAPQATPPQSSGTRECPGKRTTLETRRRISPGNYKGFQADPAISAPAKQAPVKPVPLPHEIKRSGDRILKREQIYAEIWKEPATRVAARYGISGSMLARICTTLRIPRPTRGYWARSGSWRKKHIQKLPSWSSSNADYWVVNPRNVAVQKVPSRKITEAR